jgi:hypothetical protein
MGVVTNKASLCGRLEPLKFEDSRQNEGDEAREEEVEDENHVERYKSKEQLGDDENEGHRRTSNVLKFGPLAIAEIDEELATFDLSSPTKIVNLIRATGIAQLKHTLKVLYTLTLDTSN